MPRKKKVEEPKSEIIEMLEEQPIEPAPTKQHEESKEIKPKHEMIGLRPLRRL